MVEQALPMVYAAIRATLRKDDDGSWSDGNLNDGNYDEVDAALISRHAPNTNIGIISISPQQGVVSLRWAPVVDFACYKSTMAGHEYDERSLTLSADFVSEIEVSPIPKSCCSDCFPAHQLPYNALPGQLETSQPASPRSPISKAIKLLV